MSIVVAVEKCYIQTALDYMVDFAENKMCQKCVPCPIGTRHSIELLRKLSSSEGSVEDLRLLKAIAAGMKEAVLCKKGKDAGVYLEGVIEDNSDEFEEHAAGICAPRTCLPLVKFVVNPAKCTLCGVCKEVCPEDAIIGEKPSAYLAGFKPFYIRDQKCTRCGQCLPLCEPEAIEII